jgi:hypothetical protein
MTMTAAELNCKLAEELGYRIVTGHGPYAYWVDADGRSFASHFSPATDRDHLADYVLPEIERRGLSLEFAAELVRGMARQSAETDYEGMAMAQFLVDALRSSPLNGAAAALKVLEART